MPRKPDRNTIPTFTPPGTHGPRTIWIMDRWAFVSFPYDRYINDKIALLPGRSWVPETKVWAIPLDSATAIKGIDALHYEHGFGFGQGAIEALRQIKTSMEASGLGVLLGTGETNE